MFGLLCKNALDCYVYSVSAKYTSSVFAFSASSVTLYMLLGCFVFGSYNIFLVDILFLAVKYLTLQLNFTRLPKCYLALQI